MLHTSQKLKNNTIPFWMFFQSLLVNLGQFFNENSKQILTIFILLLLAGQTGAVLNPVARRQDFSRNNDSNQDSDVCVDGECISDAVATADFTHSNNVVCIADETPVVPQLTCIAKPKATPLTAPTCPKDSYLKENVQHKLMGWEKTEQQLYKNVVLSPGAKIYYGNNIKSYRADEQILYSMIKEIYLSAASLRCTIETLLLSSREAAAGNPFGFWIVTTQEMPQLDLAAGGETAAYYSSEMNKIIMSVGIDQSDWNKIVIIHELRHALVSNENYFFKRHYNRSKNYSLAIPYGKHQSDIKEHQAFLTVINEVKSNINYYLALLNKEQQINDKLKKRHAQVPSFTAQERTALEQYKLAIKNYVAVIRHRTIEKNDIAALQADMRIDSNFTISAPGFIRYETFTGVPVYITKIELKNGEYLATCILSEPGDLRAPLLDAIPLISQYEKHHSEAVKNAMETDALYHQLYQLYPKLFNLLVEKLLAHAAARAIPEHNNCVISESRRLGA